MRRRMGVPRMTTRQLLAALESDGILTVVDVDDAPTPDAIDPDAALYVLEDAVEVLLEALRPTLVAADRVAPLTLDLPVLRAAAQLLASALIVHQTAVGR